LFEDPKMAITFHCESCKKKIKAPDGSGGKYGSCPYCNHRCYIPLPRAEDESELKLAPVDEKDETRHNKLMAETHSLTENILQEKEAASVSGARAETSEKELTKNIILYLGQMADSELDEAQKTADRIIPYRSQAIEILDRIATSDMPEPELADVAPQVLSRLIKTLRTRIS